MQSGLMTFQHIIIIIFDCHLSYFYYLLHEKTRGKVLTVSIWIETRKCSNMNIHLDDGDRSTLSFLRLKGERQNI